MKDKKSFLFYVDWIDTFESLPDDKAGKLIKHICRYVNDMNPESEELLINAVFANIKTTLKRDLDKWKAKSLKNSENAKMRWHANASERTNRNANYTDRDKVKDKVKDKEVSKSRFTPPTLDEVKAYFNEKGYTEESAVKAFEYYEANDWEDSQGKKVKSWKQKMIAVWHKPENKIKSKNNAHLFMP